LVRKEKSRQEKCERVFPRRCSAPPYANGKNARQRKRAVQLGRTMFNFGIKTRFISRTDNPFAGVSLYPENERDRVLSDKEAGKLLTELESIPPIHSKERTLRDFVLLSLLTGARKSNVMSMRWDELDLKDGAWSIPAEKTKTRRAQVIPLGPIELEVLNAREQLLKDTEEIDDDCPWVFPGKGASGHMVDPGNAWETLRDKLEMGDLWLHDLRRSLASSMANTGADVSIVRAALNHTDTRTTLKAYIRTNHSILILVAILHEALVNKSQSRLCIRLVIEG
jgi:integrase